MSRDVPPGDDDLLRTVPPGTGARAPRGQALPAGTRLAEFEVRGVVGEGGFGIVYLAWDQSLQRQVAIKEYMPWSLASRTRTTHVTPRSDKAAETFALGLRSFINEAQLLASFDHPSLLKVHRFWEGNGTAYMVMPYYQGVTLKRALAGLAAPPEEGWLKQLLAQLLDALELMHTAHCFHRDIAPDNILLLDEGIPLLLDFGAARRVIGDATQALTAFLKPGYAPVEQYAEMPSMKQGAWTDLYALASVVHYAITGHTPPESVARLVTDTMKPLARLAAGRYSAGFLRAIDHALAVRPQDRPRDVAAMRAELGLEPPRPRSHKPAEIPTTPMPLDALAGTAGADDDATLPPPGALARTAASGASPMAGARRDARPSGPRLRWLMAPVVGAGAALALLGWWLSDERPAAPSAAQPSAAAPAPATTPSAPVATSAPAAIGTIGSGDAARSADDGATGTTVGAPERSAAPAAAASAASAAPAVVDAATAAPPPALDRAPATAARSPRPTPRSNLPDPRCAEIIARVSLGETLGPDERALLQKECRK